MTEETKECRKCGRTLPLSDFRLKKKTHRPRDPDLPAKTRTWREGTCKQCVWGPYNEKRRKQRQAAREQLQLRELNAFVELPPVSERELFVLEHAACRGDHRFTDTPRGSPVARHTALREVCMGCPALEACRAVCDEIEASLGGEDERYIVGYWAAESPRERIERRKEAAHDQAA